MMKRSKYGLMLLSLLLSFMLVVAACGNNGAGNAPASTSGTSGGQEQTAGGNEPAGSQDEGLEAVTLKMVLIGGKPADHDMVFEQINAKLKEKINATLEVEYLDWADWTQKYPLKFAANEDFDLVYTANWAFYTDQALKGGFLELTEDMIKQYAPMTWEAMPQSSWDQALVNGKLYMIPQNSSELLDKAVIYREDLRKKYSLPEINSLETFAQYLKTIAANEKGLQPYGAKAADGWRWHELDQATLEQANDFNLITYDLPIAYDLNDPSGKLFVIYDTPEFRELLAYYKDLADNGAWSRNVVSNKNDVWTDMKAGKVASYAHNLGTIGGNLQEARREVPDLEFMIADITPNSKKLAAISTQNGFAVHATSKHPERSLMAIDLFQNDRELHDLIIYGIAGVPYNPVGDDTYEQLVGFSNFTGFSNWGFNSPLNRDDASYPQEALDMAAEWEKNVFHHPLETFVLDESNIKNQMGNIGNVMLRYALPLEYGLVDDLDAGLAELLDQLKAAGIDEVLAEIQSQVDAFLAQ